MQTLTTPISKNICKRLLLIVVIYCTENWIKLFRNQICLFLLFKHKTTLFYLLSFAFIQFITRCHSLSFIVIFCYSLPFTVTRCHSLSFVLTCCTTRCHSLSLVVIRCAARCYSLSFVVIRCHSMYHSSVFLWTIDTERALLKKDVKNFANITGKHLCWSLFLIKLQVCRPTNFIKRRLQHRYFSCQNSGIFKSTYFKEHLKNKEHLPTAASCVSEAKYAYVINCQTRWNQLYISTIVSEKCSCFVLCLKFSSLFYKIFV